MTSIETLPVDGTLPDEAPELYVEAMVRRAGTSFFWAMRRLEPARRQAVFAVYAFCRDVDDIADGVLPLDQKKALLDAWRAEIELLYGGAATHPITHALTEPVRNYDLRKNDFLAVIDGMEMDASPRVQIADMLELELYCDRVACAVGRLCVRIFGMPEDDGIELAKSLGEALQLTNILRDIIEDLELGRIYLPADMLTEENVVMDTPARLRNNEGLERVCSELSTRALQRFEQSDAIIARSNPKSVRPAIMMQEVYRRVLSKLIERGWLNLDTDVSPSKIEKMAIALRFGLFG